jgi:hypothetical protein
MRLGYEAALYAPPPAMTMAHFVCFAIFFFRAMEQLVFSFKN